MTVRAPGRIPVRLLVAMVLVVVLFGLPPAGTHQTILSAVVGPKVAIIVGPNGPRTVENRDRANAAAREALLYTSNVVKVYSPNATWARVKAAINGASIVIYYGRGKGFPSPNGGTITRSHDDGFGLNPVAGRGNETTTYYGESYIRTVRLATGALVLLHPLAYASGNSEPGRAEPTLSVARRRVDNYAAGFLAAGAAVVVAETDKSLAPYYIRQTFLQDATLDAIWRVARTANGHISTFVSLRTNGATGRTDPLTARSGFTRSIVGRLTTTTSTVRGEPTRAQMRTLYMSPTGSDRANGLTIATPFRTLRYWTGGSLRAGDTVLVRGGVQAADPSDAGSTWSVKVSGTAAAPITIKAYPGEVPVFDGRSTVPAAFQVIGVSYLTLEGLAFTGYRPYESGVINISSSSHITLRNLHFYGNVGNGPGDSTSDHEVYISNGASDVLIDGSILDGIQGNGVQVYSGSSEAPSSSISVTNSTISNMGWSGILLRANTTGGTFTNNVLTGNGSGLNIAYSTGLVVSDNQITGPRGFEIAGNGLAGVGLTDSHNCIDSPDPFRVASKSWTLAQWQASGHGNGTTVGTCP